METHQENIHNGLEGCNLSNFHCTSSSEISKVTQILYPPKTPLDSCLSVTVKLYNIYWYTILTGFCFKGVNKRILEEKRSEAYSGPSQMSTMNYVCKSKSNLKQSFVRAFHARWLKGTLTRSWLSVPKPTFKKTAQIKCISNTNKTLFWHILT